MKHKKKLNSTASANSHLLLVVAVVIGLAGAMLYKHPAQAVSERGKTAAAVLGGGGTGALIAGVAGSAKWAPLGFGAGAIGALLIKRAIRKNRERRTKMQTQPVQYHESRRMQRRNNRMQHDQNMSGNYMQSNYQNR